MIKARERWVNFLRGDVSIREKDETTAPDEKIISILDRFSNGVKYYNKDNPLIKKFSNENIHIRLVKSKIDKRQKLITLLWVIGDKNTVDPMYWDIKSNKSRKFGRKEGEIVGFSSHTVIKIDQSIRNSFVIIQEKTPDFTKARISMMLESILNAGIEIKADQIFCSVSSLPSQSLLDILNHGKILDINAIQSQPSNERIDESWYIQRADKKILIKAEEPTQGTFDKLKKLVGYARREQYNVLSIRYKEHDSIRTISMNVSDEDSDIEESMFDRVEKITVSSPIDQIQKTPHEEFESKMKAKLQLICATNGEDKTNARESTTTQTPQFSSHTRASQLSLL